MGGFADFNSGLRLFAGASCFEEDFLPDGPANVHELALLLLRAGVEQFEAAEQDHVETAVVEAGSVESLPLLNEDDAAVLEEGLDGVHLELAEDRVVVLEADVRDVHLDFFVVLIAGQQLSSSGRLHSFVASELLPDLEEALLDFLLDLRLELFLHVVHFEVVALEVLQRVLLLVAGVDLGEAAHRDLLLCTFQLLQIGVGLGLVIILITHHWRQTLISAMELIWVLCLLVTNYMLLLCLILHRILIPSRLKIVHILLLHLLGLLPSSPPLVTLRAVLWLLKRRYDLPLCLKLTWEILRYWMLSQRTRTVWHHAYIVTGLIQNLRTLLMLLLNVALVKSINTFPLLHNRW